MPRAPLTVGITPFVAQEAGERSAGTAIDVWRTIHHEQASLKYQPIRFALVGMLPIGGATSRTWMGASSCTVDARACPRTHDSANIECSPYRRPLVCTHPLAKFLFHSG